MALIKCLECSREVSDKAVNCPQCGNPINATERPLSQISSNTEKPVHIEFEVTNKAWKKKKIIAWVMIVYGFFAAGISNGNQGSLWFWFGVLAIFIGAVLLFISKIGGWYDDKRTR
jgi:DNA-directed RNA polymerase subunit RPC12/RpoP